MPNHPNDLDLDIFKVGPTDPTQTTTRIVDIPKSKGDSDFRTALEYWYRGYRPMNLNFDSEKEQNNEDTFYDSTHDEDDSSIFDF